MKEDDERIKKELYPVVGLILQLHKKEKQQLCLHIMKSGGCGREQTDREESNKEGRNEFLGFILKLNKKWKQVERTRIILVSYEEKCLWPRTARTRGS